MRGLEGCRAELPLPGPGQREGRVRGSGRGALCQGQSCAGAPSRAWGQEALGGGPARLGRASQQPLAGHSPARKTWDVAAGTSQAGGPASPGSQLTPAVLVWTCPCLGDPSRGPCLGWAYLRLRGERQGGYGWGSPSDRTCSGAVPGPSCGTGR